MDAHQLGLGAILAQGKSMEDSKPVAVASRTTHAAEKRYPQLDLEWMTVDLALRRFRHYLVGSSKPVIVITDHKRVCAIFNGKRKGSIRTERIKLRNHDIKVSVVYQEVSSNQSDYLSRHAKPLKYMNEEEKKEPDELNNLLYSLHMVPFIDCIGISEIAKETASDKVLSELQEYITQGKHWILKTASNGYKGISRCCQRSLLQGMGFCSMAIRLFCPKA